MGGGDSQSSSENMRQCCGMHMCNKSFPGLTDPGVNKERETTSCGIYMFRETTKHLVDPNTNPY